MPIPVSARTKTWVCDRSLTGIAGSNPTGGIGACLLWMSYVIRQRSLRRADPSSRVVPTKYVVTNCVWPRNLNNEATRARVGPLRHKKKSFVKQH